MADVAVKRRTRKHAIHTSYIRHIPLADIAIELRFIEDSAHVRHVRDINHI